MLGKSQVKIHWDGQIYNIECEENETILAAALRANIDVPFGCMSGTCSSCQAHKIKGGVKMGITGALTDEDIAQGEILTCQSHPTTQEVEIDYTL